MNLEKYLTSLLQQHDCVIVPEFGAFIANYEAARIQAATHTILPPRKFLVFNSNLTINDGLLATTVSQNLSCSFEEAMHLIRQAVASWHEMLKEGKTLTLDGIGTFHINKSSRLEFKPDPDQNFFDEAFGLKALVIPPVKKRIRKYKPVRVNYHKPVRKPMVRKIRRLAWAAVITVPLVAAGVWSIMHLDTLQQFAHQHSGLIIPFRRHFPGPTQNTYQIKTGEQRSATAPIINEQDALHESFVPEYTEPVPETSGNEENTSVTTLTTPETETTIPQPPAPAGCDIPAPGQRAYYIIVGSFENDTNAQHLSGELSNLGWNAKVIESSEGMYRVSIVSCVLKQQALEQLARIREEQNPGAWLLRM